MSLNTIILDTPLDADQLKSVVRFGELDGASDLGVYLQAMQAGVRSGTVYAKVGATRATATLTVSSTGSANNETCTIAGVTFTAKTSGATGNQFNISTTPATQASNMAAAINASANLANIVTAAVVGAVVTVSAVVPGLIGNGLQISENLANVALSDFLTRATASDGTNYTIDLA